MIKGILFDFDGTIVDSEESRFMSINYVLEDFGKELSRKEWDENYKSFGTVEILNKLKEKYEIIFDSQKLYDESHSYRLKYEERRGVPIIKGFKEFYKEVKKLGIQTIVCTGGKTSHMKFVLKLCDIEIEGFGREEYKNRKPAPDCFLEGLKRLGLVAEECIVFEDAKNGMLSAKNANLKTVAINCSEDISELDNVIVKYKDYTEIDLEELQKINKN